MSKLFFNFLSEMDKKKSYQSRHARPQQEATFSQKKLTQWQHFLKQYDESSGELYWDNF